MFVGNANGEETLLIAT